MSGYTKTYAIPAREVAAIERLGVSYEEARSAHDGYLSSWIERYRFERDGKERVALQERGQGWAIEIAIDPSGMIVEVIPLPPEKARALEDAEGV